jgi:hypothetical protein
MSTSVVYDSFVPLYDSVPEEWGNARQTIVEMNRKISTCLNSREIGFCLLEETLSGKQLFLDVQPTTGTTQQFRDVFRTMVNFGPLPASGTVSKPHGIDFTDNNVFVVISATATDPIGFTAIPIPFSSVTTGQNIQITVDAVNVNITTTYNYSNYTTCIVTLEYTKQA